MNDQPTGSTVPQPGAPEGDGTFPPAPPVPSASPMPPDELAGDAADDFPDESPAHAETVEEANERGDDGTPGPYISDPPVGHELAASDRED